MKAKEDVPDLAEEGDSVVLSMTDMKHPISVTVEHGPEVLRTIYEHADSLEVITSPAPALIHLQVLERILGREPLPEIRVVK